MNTTLKHPKFNVENAKQRNLMRALGNVGIMRYRDAKSHYGAENIEKLEVKKFVVVEKKMVGGKVENTIHLKKKGMDYTRRYLVYDALYKRSSYQIAHDLELAKEYLGLTKDEQKSWMNDAAIKKYLDEKGEGIEAIDGAYTDGDGQLVGVEIFTKSYSNETIAAKMETLKTYFRKSRIGRA